LTFLRTDEKIPKASVQFSIYKDFRFCLKLDTSFYF
jgi:hypothetical protein